MTTATVTRETAHRFQVRWFARPDLVIVEKVSGPDLTDAVSAATTLLAANGFDVLSVTPTPTGNATLEVTQS